MTETTPGTWSTDEYIRAWARRRGMDAQQECLVPLQSLQQHWLARVRFDVPGNPVERFLRDEATPLGDGNDEDVRSVSACPA